MSEKVVLALDPGSQKCGMALVKRHQSGHLELLWHQVTSTESLADRAIEAHDIAPFQLIIVGGGTTSNKAVAAIRERMVGAGILVVDETNTTLQARERYWEHHPRKGWRRLWPATLQEPPEPVDDFVALILAERVLLER